MRLLLLQSREETYSNHRGQGPHLAKRWEPRGFSRVAGKPPRAPQLEETPETPPSSRAEGLLFLPGLESNHESSLKSEEEAGLP